MSDQMNIDIERVPLDTVPGTGTLQPEDTSTLEISSSEDIATSCCNDKHHRKLAIGSIICGCTCIGIPALIYSVKAEQSKDKKAAEYLKRAKKFGIISIVVWFSFLALFPLLLGLFSYLATLYD